MTKEKFLEKYSIDRTSLYYYKKRFPEVVVANQIDFSILNKILQDRIDIKEKVQEILIDKKPIDIEYLFKGKNKKTMSHIFIYQLYGVKTQILIVDRVLKKYISIIEKFSNKDRR